jgi:hypothetical protein
VKFKTLVTEGAMAANDAASLPLIPSASNPRDWRINREVRFTWRQQRTREWINFAEIAEWLAELNGRGVPDKAARLNAYDMLQRDLLTGNFEAGRKSQVRFLHFTSPMARMTRERLNTLLDMVETGGLPVDSVRSEYLARCWIPRRLAKHVLPTAPARFEPQKAELPAPPVRAEQTPEPAMPPARGVKPAVRKAVVRFIIDRWPQGVPSEIGYKQIARDFEASDVGFPVSERTVRRALGRK